MVECYYCGRRFPRLYKLTREDVQREHLPAFAFQMSCAECLDRIRLAANLVPEQNYNQAARNFSWMIPLFTIILAATATLVSLVRVGGLGQLGFSSRWLGTGTVLVGILMVWDRLNRRYGFTHDLRWSLNSKRVNLALAILLAALSPMRYRQCFRDEF